MRSLPLVRRWLDARQLIAGLSLVVIALGLLAYWAWQASVRRHVVAIELLRSHAELAAQRLGARMQNELYLGATTVFRNAARAAVDSAARPLAPSTVLRGAGMVDGCNCAPPLAPAYALRTDLTTSGTEIAGSQLPSAGEREAVLAALREQLVRMPPGWDVAVVRANAGMGGRVVLFTRRSRPDSAPLFIGFATDSATVREFIVRPLLCNTPLVIAGNRTRGMHNDSLVAVRLADASGAELYRTTTPIDESIATTTVFPLEWGELAITASLRPQAATLVLPGGVPRSPVPLLIALVATATTLVGVAILMIWRMHELSRLRADFTSSVSHELRTPLTQILLFAETIEMGRQRSPEKRAEAIGVITRETRRLIHLVENVLQFSRAERSLTRLRLAPVDVGVIVADTVAGFEPIAEARGASVSLRLDTPVRANADADALRRILLNLLDNAVRYGPAGQTITVAVASTGSWVRITVDDEGPGVPDHARDGIWKPFVRLDETTDGSAGGCGIGLSIVSELVALHGGRRGVQARPGGGASFFVDLAMAPTVEPPAPYATAVHDREPLGTTGR